MTEIDDSAPWPTDIRVNRQEKQLNVTFDNGDSFTLPAELLRVESPSAEVQGHGPGQKVILAGRRHIGIMDVEPIGNYAIKIKFDDMHDTGIYSFGYLHFLGMKQDTLWQTYLDALEKRGLTRDP